MRDEMMRHKLGILESAEPERSARDAARARMLDVFDGEDTSGFGDVRSDTATPGVGEVIQLLDEDRRNRSGRDLAPGSRPWLPAAAAAVVLVALLVGGAMAGGLFDRESAPEVAETGTILAADDGDESPPRPFVDDQLPRLIEGRFTTGVLGGTTSFVVRDPLWLVRHEAGLVRLVVDPNDPAGSSLVLARPGVPGEVVGDQTVIEFLRDDADTEFQLQPLDVDGLASTYARGQYFGPSCPAEEPCVRLFETPMPLGLRSGVIADFVERPMSDGGTVVLLAAIPFSDFDLAPFGRPFVSIIETITFSDTEAVGNSG